MSKLEFPENGLLPDLFKLSTKGKIQYWAIRHDGNKITVTHGQHGGKLQITEEFINEGKNIGKANETTPAEQARLEAIAKHEHQVKKGYVTDITKAQEGKVDETVIEGGLQPMLAHKYRDHADKIKWPCYAQPKLDGIRCIAIIKDGKCTLWSRTRKPINSVPHIVASLENMLKGQTMTLDGELYVHKYKKDFEKIVSLVRQENPGEGHEIVEYHVYDVVSNDPFSKRCDAILQACQWPYVWAVGTSLINSPDEAMALFQHYCEEGYEGLMLRNADSLYENKRSYNLQKVKDMVDSEFEIVGVEEARGKRAGQAVVVLVTKDGKRFKAVPRGSDELREKMFKNANKLIGKLGTVQYQALTADGIPRFPVFARVRDSEDF